MQLAELRRQGLSIRQIARRLSLGLGTVVRTLEELYRGSPLRWWTLLLGEEVLPPYPGTNQRPAGRESVDRAGATGGLHRQPLPGAAGQSGGFGAGAL